MSRYCIIFPILMLFGLTACGGTIRDREISSDNPSIPPWSGSKIPIQISKVSNKTGQSKYDDLCHYLHIKAAQLLADTGRYDVVSDDLIDQQSIFIEGVELEPEEILEINVNHVSEYNGGTFKIAVFSTQRKRAEVEISIVNKKPDGALISKDSSADSSTVGAWGVLAEVDRKKMLSGEGFWNVDNSMLGIAASRALRGNRIITK